MSCLCRTAGYIRAILRFFICLVPSQGPQTQNRTPPAEPCVCMVGLVTYSTVRNTGSLLQRIVKPREVAYLATILPFPLGAYSLLVHSVLLREFDIVKVASERQRALNNNVLHVLLWCVPPKVEEGPDFVWPGSFRLSDCCLE